MVTKDWLAKHKIPYDHFFIRKAKDNRSDWIVKEEILREMEDMGLFPDIVFDDRNQVVDMWRRNGLVVHQVVTREEGDF